MSQAAGRRRARQDEATSYCIRSLRYEESYRIDVSGAALVCTICEQYVTRMYVVRMYTGLASETMAQGPSGGGGLMMKLIA